MIRRFLFVFWVKLLLLLLLFPTSQNDVEGSLAVSSDCYQCTPCPVRVVQWLFSRETLSRSCCPVTVLDVHLALFPLSSDCYQCTPCPVPVVQWLLSMYTLPCSCCPVTVLNVHLALFLLSNDCSQGRPCAVPVHSANVSLPRHENVARNEHPGTACHVNLAGSFVWHEVVFLHLACIQRLPALTVHNSFK